MLVLAVGTFRGKMLLNTPVSDDVDSAVVGEAAAVDAVDAAAIVQVVRARRQVEGDLKDMESGVEVRVVKLSGERVVVDVVAIEVDVVAAQNKAVVDRLDWTSWAHIADVTDHGRGRSQPRLASPEMLQH